MHFDPEDPQHIQRLRGAIRYSEERLAPFRQAEYEGVSAMVGKHGGHDSTTPQTPRNHIEQAVDTYATYLAPGDPRALVTTRRRELKATAATLEEQLNRKSIDIELGESLFDAVIASFFGLAIVKVGTADKANKEIEGYLHDVGEVYVDPVLLSDWVHDMGARRWDEIGYMGNYYQLPLEAAKEAGGFEKKEREKLTEDTQPDMTQTGEESVAALGRGSGYKGDEYLPRTRLLDLWLPSEKLFLTLPAESGMPLRIKKWDGPEIGPYRMLSYMPVIGSTMPLPPVAVWRDLHDLANILWRRMRADSERDKSVGVMAGTGAREAEVFRAAEHGDLLQGAFDINEVHVGGISPQTMALAIQVDQAFSRSAGNLDMLAGLGPQSPTLGQDELLASTASKRLGQMQGRVQRFVRQIFEDIAWHVWHDPMLKMPLVKHSKEGNADIAFVFEPEQRRGKLSQYDIKIDPYALEYSPPGARLQKLMTILTRIVVPMAPIWQAQGMQISAKELTRILSKYANLPEIEDLFEKTGIPEQSGAAPPSERNRPRQSPVTERNYTRTSRPGGTAQGRADILTRALMGGQVQGSEIESLQQGTAG